MTGDVKLSSLIRRLFLTAGYKYVFLMRSCSYSRKHPLLRITVYPIVRMMLMRSTYRYGIDVSYKTSIGSGFYIGHFGGVIVHRCSVIGKNCNLSHGVTIGKVNRGNNKGYPTIGDNVYIGPGAKIVGAVRIGNNVAIGANCVVTKDVPDNAVAVGVPGRVISNKGSTDYVNNTDYEEKIS